MSDKMFEFPLEEIDEYFSRRKTFSIYSN